MSRLRGASIWIVLVLGAAAVAIVLSWSAWGGSDEELVGPTLGDVPLVALASVSPRSHFVADRIVATLEITVDRSRVEPRAVGVSALVRPYSLVGPIEVTRRDLGDTTILRYAFPLQCLDRPCVLRAGAGAIELPAAIVRYPTPIGQGLLSVKWPPLDPMSRLAGAELEDPKFRAGPLEPPTPSYRINPNVLGWLAASLAAVIVLAVAVVVGRRLRPSPPEPVATAGEAAPGLPPIERALLRVEEAAGRADEDRRAALESLARALDGNGLARLAPRARRLAWSRSAPTSDATRELAGAVRRALEGDEV